MRHKRFNYVQFTSTAFKFRRIPLLRGPNIFDICALLFGFTRLAPYWYCLKHREFHRPSPLAHLTNHLSWFVNESPLRCCCVLGYSLTRWFCHFSKRLYYPPLKTSSLALRFRRTLTVTVSSRTYVSNIEWWAFEWKVESVTQLSRGRISRGTNLWYVALTAKILFRK